MALTNGLDHGHNLPRSALVLYGTETGTAQDLAEEVGRCLERLRFSVDVVEFDSASYSQLSLYNLTVCVMSTTGQGDMPSNSRKFWKSLLRKRLSSTTLEGIMFASVGLGDTSYPKFNWAARKLEKRLKQLGAIEIVESCEADEQGEDSTDGMFLVWLKMFRETVVKDFPLSDGLEAIPEDAPLPNKWILRSVSDDDTRMTTANGYESNTTQGDHEFEVELEKNERATPSTHWQDVRFMKFRTTKPIDYLPGDALAIYPENMPDDVNTILQRLEWNEIADQPVELFRTRQPTSNNHFIYPPIPPSNPQEPRHTLRSLLTTKLDINAIPRRSFFSRIAQYTTDEQHKDRLLEFADPQFLDEYYDYATRPRRSILEILQEFHTVEIPWQEAVNVFPILRKREFSIASSSRGSSLMTSGNPSSNHNSNGDGNLQTNEGTTFDLLVAIVKYRTVIKRIRQGVCTRYLSQLPAGSKIRVALKTEGRFFNRRQDVLKRNLLLIGAGTGVAPLRALVWEKFNTMREKTEQLQQHRHRDEDVDGQHVNGSNGVNYDPNGTAAVRCGTASLVFGARNQEADHFFADEWESFSTSSSSSSTLSSISTSTTISIPMNIPFEVHTAFSRDQGQKIYVQDRIRSLSSSMRRLLCDPSTTVVICGASGAMPKAVRQAFVDVLCDKSSSEEEEEEEQRAVVDARGDHGEGRLGESGTVEQNGGRNLELMSFTADLAEEFLTKLEKDGRYKQETWS